MLVLPLHVTHNILSHAAMAFDVSHTRDTAGRPVVVQGLDYRIGDFNLQPASDDQIKLLPEGAQSDGALVAHTRSKLKTANVVNGLTENVQTYVRHNGNIWKVWAIQDWNQHSVIGRYILTKYVDIDGIIV